MVYHEFGLSVKDIAKRLSILEQYVQSVLENEMLGVEDRYEKRTD